MIARLSISPLAEQDLEAIGDYIATSSSARAKTFIRELRSHCRRITLNPLGYPLRPELGLDIRSCSTGNYVIFFAAAKNDVTIVRVLHGARDIPSVFSSKQNE